MAVYVPIGYIANRGFAGRPPELKWLHTSPIFSGFSLFFRHFEGQRYRTFYCKNHRHYCDLNANQICYTFRYVLSYFHNENELTELKRFISGCNSIFVYKLQYILTSKMADFILLTWLQLRKTNYYVTSKTSIIIFLSIYMYTYSYIAS